MRIKKKRTCVTAVILVVVIVAVVAGVGGGNCSDVCSSSID